MKERKIKLYWMPEHNIFGYMLTENPRSSASIMHLDVDDLSSRRQTDSPYEISSVIF